MVVPLARALRAAGHEVMVATGDSLAADLDRFGLPHRSMPRMLAPTQLAEDPDYARSLGFHPDESRSRNWRSWNAVPWSGGSSPVWPQSAPRWTCWPSYPISGPASWCEVVALGRGSDVSTWTGPRPATVHLASFVQQPLLLQACDLFVTHAGFGGVREALTAGVPMVALPLYAEQPANAQRLTELGLGVTVDAYEADPATIAAACRKVLDDPSSRFAARAFRRRLLGLPTISQLVADLTALGA
jgi:UDP:flavonoid glycosyltransferase YjiC (YdhE family)